MALDISEALRDLATLNRAIDDTRKRAAEVVVPDGFRAAPGVVVQQFSADVEAQLARFEALYL